jgi:CheY-like chemotaxis protein
MPVDHDLVLLVDDHEDTRVTLAELLAAHGVPVVQAEDGQVALTVMHEEARVGLVLLDVMMPRVDGLTVLRRMRDDPATRSLPVVVMSGKAAAAPQARAAGCDAFLLKPVSLDTLLCTLRRLGVCGPAPAPAKRRPGH